MEMYVAGKWQSGNDLMEIRSPFSGEVIDSVPNADNAAVEAALSAAVQGAAAMRKLTAYERYKILMKAADLVERDAEELARTVTMEQGKPLKEARGELSRMPDLLRLCAFEGSQMRGETLPVDAQVGAQGKMGFTMRIPCGVVVAIAPFNFPVLLVLHKLGPALAAGNAVILKPAHQTPFSSLKLTRLFLEAGLPEHGLQCITGSGSRVGGALCADPRVRKISFTGSAPVGEAITRSAGIKKLSLELGSNAPMVVLDDANLEQVAAATAVGGFVNAGQVCISTQRVLVSQKVYTDYLDLLKDRVGRLKTGDPTADETSVSALISEAEAIRVSETIREAAGQGARVLVGGERQGNVVAPAVVADVRPEMRIASEELFGPAVGVTPVRDVEEAIAVANNSEYGLGASIFTQDITKAMRFVREVESGNVMVNWTPLWRADLMPYGGLKRSGIGKEGPRYALQEMTELKTVVIHGLE